MRVEITAVHRHDGWASDSRSFIGATGTANWSAKTPGIPDWFGMDFTPDPDQPCSQLTSENSNVIFFAVKFKELQDET